MTLLIGTQKMLTCVSFLGLPPRRLDGIPVIVKDNYAVEQMPMTCASNMLRGKRLMSISPVNNHVPRLRSILYCHCGAALARRRSNFAGKSKHGRIWNRVHKRNGLYVSIQLIFFFLRV